MIKGYYVSGNTMVQELSTCVRAISVPITNVDVPNNRVYLDGSYINGKKVLGFIVECAFEGAFEYEYADGYTPEDYIVNCDLPSFDANPTKVTMLYLE